jgi:hypothetical protein
MSHGNTCLGIAFSVYPVAQSIQQPSEMHGKVDKKIFSRGTKDKVLYLKPQSIL